ncbi:hypothetical protein [Taibaiella koreensis]|uniref:hypothetical protein n=1 Tax=Taibaiella koreensis TaxID=1268548 RepID=UPI000E59C0A8|nr:hypothetical protein [Taibaiella koreensis]
METTNKTYRLEDCFDEDVFDVAQKLEKSFDLTLPVDAFIQVHTLGDLCAVFERHITARQCNDCTSQQAFYRVRRAIAATLSVDEKEITPDDQLAHFFPKANLRRKVNTFQAHLGIKVPLLTYPNWLLAVFLLLFLIFFVSLFFGGRAATVGGLLFFAGIDLAKTHGRKLIPQTIRQLTEQLVSEHYTMIRTRKGTVNRKEVRRIIVNTFARDLDIDKTWLTMDAKFFWA